jgi:hypothetical protein
MAGTTAAVVGAGAAVAGAVGSAKAAKAQSKAAGDAADAQAAAAAAMREDLTPYNELGQDAINPLLAAMGYSRLKNGDFKLNPNATLQKQFSFNAANLDKTPGYQFALNQGLRGTTNQLAAQGLGLSGAQAKGLSNYATGLAQQTYNDQYNNALSTYNTNYQVASNNVSNLQNLLNVGQNSAAQTGQAGLNAANNAGNYLTQGANAQAAGYTGVANAVGNAANNYLLYNALYK